MTPQPHRLVPLLLAFGFLACVNDLGHDPQGEPARLEIRAVLAGLGAATIYTVNVQVSYQVVGGATKPLEADPSSFTITGEGSSRRQAVGVTLTPCLNDPDRLDAESNGCRLSVTLTLTDDKGELAQATQDLGLVQEGDQKSAGDITITPNYELEISGGGPGTGSGTVTVAAIAGQAALSCQIIDGAAAAEGCSARYPLHTPLVLTTANGTLGSWGNDCATSEATAVCTLSMDGHRSVRASFTPTPTTGELEVQIAGLPPGTPAQVTVINSSGFNQSLTESQVLTDLQPGNYTVSATPITVAADTYTPEPAEQVANVVVGERSTAQIGYNPPLTGSLAIAITGLPDGTAAAVTVTGPNGFSQSLTAGQTLPGLIPGTYTIAANSVETADQVYAPVPTRRQRTVSAQETTQDTVAYGASRASLIIAIGGLPAGVNPDITVTGPDGYRQDLISTTTSLLVKLTPGRYTVVARSVSSADLIYDPTLAPEQPVTLTAGGSGTVTVTYSAVTEAPVSAERSSVEVSTTALRTCCGSSVVTVTARDANGNPVSGASVTLAASGAGNVLTQPSDSTNAQGVAVGSLSSSMIGAKLISATVNGIALTSTVTVQVSAGIAFTRETGDNNRDIVTVNPDGSDPVNLTQSSGDEFEAEWSPDGSMLAFTSQCVRCAPDIHVMSADGSNRRVVARNARQPTWAPDGSHIAFTRLVAATEFVRLQTIFVVNLQDGSEVNLTTRLEVEAASPAWSPRGTHIAFTALVGDQSDIFVMNSDGSNPVNLTPGDTLESDPAWSPGGGRIAFTTRCEFCEFFDVGVMNANGSGRVNLTRGFENAALLPAWSPDGSRMAFSSLDGNIYVMNADGSSPRLVIADGFDPTWR